MDDVCPHRMAPLSEGRIDRDTDRIECSYHGWAFDTRTGRCQVIPQLTTEQAVGPCNSPRACVATYPTVVHKSILWYWPWSPDLDPLQVAVDVAAHPEGMLQGVANYTTTYTRDLPYGWDALLENLLDPAHVPFAHHGLQGTRDDAIPINMTRPVFKQPNAERGFTYEWSDRTMKMKRKGTADFRAPFVVTYDAAFIVDTPDKKKFEFCAICIPTKPGWSRVIVVTPDSKKIAKAEKEENQKNNPAVKKEENKNKPSLFFFILRLLPVWVIHQFSNRFFDSDLAFLHYQERKKAQDNNQKGGTRGYYMPAPSDRGVIALYKWLNDYARSAPHLSLLPSNTELYAPRSVLFDRQVQHTSHCKHCQDALVGISKWRRNAYRVMALAILAWKKFSWPASIVAVLCLGVLRVLATIEPSFKEGEFKHYQNE